MLCSFISHVYVSIIESCATSSIVCRSQLVSGISFSVYVQDGHLPLPSAVYRSLEIGYVGGFMGAVYVMYTAVSCGGHSTENVVAVERMPLPFVAQCLYRRHWFSNRVGVLWAYVTKLCEVSNDSAVWQVKVLHWTLFKVLNWTVSHVITISRYHVKKKALCWVKDGRVSAMSHVDDDDDIVNVSHARVVRSNISYVFRFMRSECYIRGGSMSSSGFAYELPLSSATPWMQAPSYMQSLETAGYQVMYAECEATILHFCTFDAVLYFSLI